MLGFRAASSCQRVPVPRYLRASCQRVSPEEMRIEVICPDALLARAATGRGVIGYAIGRFAVDEDAIGRSREMDTIGDGRDLGARVGAGFIEAKGIVAIASGYVPVGTFDGREMADWLGAVWTGAGAVENDGTGLVSGVDAAAIAAAASSSRFLAR
jgi:hypothetical protein